MLTFVHSYILLVPDCPDGSCSWT